jgi:hypothetical protein
MKARPGTIHASCRSPEFFSLQNFTFSRPFPSNPPPTFIFTAQKGLTIETIGSSLIMFNYRREEVIGKRSRDLSLWAFPEFREAGLLQPFSKEA